MSEPLCSEEGLFFLTAETGRLKTDLGECNLNVTCLVDKCCKILVSITVSCYEQIT